MKELIIYQLEVAGCLAIFYLFYQLLLKKETHFTLRRYYFLAAAILAFVIPAMHFSIDLTEEEASLPTEYLQYLPQQFMEFTPIYSPVQSSLDVWTIVGYIWLIGFMIMCTRICLSLFQVLRVLRRSAHGENSNLFKISDSKTQSFSFFKNIVLSKNQYQSHAFNYILAHEQAHSDQYHSVDVLLMEMIKATQWFNPFVWWLTKEALQNLEYLADESVIEKHPNSMEYQKAIVQFAQPSYVNHLRSEFSKSNLKNRISMMNRPKASKIHAWKFLLLLPIIGVMLMSFSLKVDNMNIRQELSELLPVINFPESKITNSGAFTSIKKVPTQQQSMLEANPKDSTDNGLRIRPTKLTGVRITKVNTNALSPQSNFLHQQEALRYRVGYAISNPNTNSEERVINGSTEDGKRIQKDMRDSISSTFDVGPRPATGDMSSFFNSIYANLNYPKKAKKKGIEGKVFVQFVVQKDGTLKDVKAVKGIGYGCNEEAVRLLKEGPDWIAGKKDDKNVNTRMILPISFRLEKIPEQQSRTILGKVSDEKGDFIAGAVVSIIGTNSGTVTDKDGNFVLKVDEGYTEIVFASKGMESQIYKIRDPNEPMVITMKENETLVKTRIRTVDTDSASGIKYFHSSSQTMSKSSPTRVMKYDMIPQEDRPLFLLDGKEDYEEFKLLNHGDIKSTDFIKKDEAIAIYGEKGKNGVIIVKTKAASKPIYIVDGKTPLYIVDDKEVSEEEMKKSVGNMSKIDDNRIGSIQVLKDTAATAIYGEKAKHGVIIIKTK